MQLLERTHRTLRPERDTGATSRLCLEGEIDLATAPPLEKRLQHAKHAGASGVVLDVGRLRFIDARGLRVIAFAFGLFGRDHVRLIGVQPALRHLMHLAGLDTSTPLEQASR